MSESEQQQAQPAPEQPAAQEAPVAAAPEAPKPQVVAGVGFMVLAFNDEKEADLALDAMKEAKKRKQFYFEDAAVIRQDEKGKVHYHETGDMSTGKGAGIGALVGGVLSLLGGPIGLAVGAGIGALAGGAVASKDSGFRNESLNTVGVALKPGTSAVVAITSGEFLKAVQKQVPIEEIRSTVSGLSAEISAALAEKKDLAIGILLTEGGLAIRKIAVNEQSAEVVGAVITSDLVIAGAAVATEDATAYEVVAATAEGAIMEAGVVDSEGAVIVQAVALPEAAVAELAAEPEEANKAADATKAADEPEPAADEAPPAA